ncbi:ABC transporter substrate-binding protein [Litorivicinus sp.]|jgi:putative hydroxymethylpyrimidine transport system substrate-binding protein|nr:ABC transporter substrate-binding protein [Litorivicinus sp.]MDC1319083.1 ABC transporter substrate-binding protein [Litorivicinus sp.]MDC1466386.1 ABC transporter substrate-binding protein [Litorivicinus sp.]|tara:strand:+ start:9092 stop:10054 length:963 start_codon:yes stop_codon:yes gene_type:complete
MPQIDLNRFISVVTLIFVTTLSSVTARAESITVLLDWFVNPDHAPLIVAKQRGLFRQAGLDVTLIEPADPSLPPKLVAAKQADLAVSYQPALMLDLENGLPLVRIGTLVASPLNSLVVLANSGIKEISDLKGKTVGFSVGGFEDALLGQMLETHGLSLSDINLVNVNFALSPSLYTGAVDAVIGAFRNFELNQMEIDGREGLAFYPEEHGIPTYEELIFIAHPESAQLPKMQKFLDIIDQATAQILENSDGAWADFVAYKPNDLNNILNRRAWTDTIPKLAKKTRSTNPEAWDQFATFMKKRGLISEVKDSKSYLVNLQR